MTLRRRHFLQLAGGALAAPAVSRLGYAQAYPSKPVRLLCGSPPGNAPDIIARLLAHGLSERLGQQFIVENRPGAANNIAVEAAVNAPADGYTLIVTILSNVFNMSLYPNLRFNFIRDIAAVAGVADAPYLLQINPSVPARTLPEFIAYAKANPGKINHASSGNGSSGHIFTELFKTLAGVDMVHVTYRGQYMPDLLSGQVQLAIAPMPLSMQYFRSGDLRTLGVSTAKRLATVPDVPAIAEYVPGYEAVGWYGLGAPQKTPPEIVQRLNAVMNDVLADKQVTQRFAAMGISPMPMSPERFATFIADDHAKWSKVIKQAGVKPN